jgi:hypothetical protein
MVKHTRQGILRALQSLLTGGQTHRLARHPQTFYQNREGVIENKYDEPTYRNRRAVNQRQLSAKSWNIALPHPSRPQHHRLLHRINRQPVPHRFKRNAAVWGSIPILPQ